MKKPKRINYMLFALAAVTLVSAALAYLHHNPPYVLKDIDNLVYDKLMVMQGPSKPKPDIVIIDIDDKSLKEKGQWPWPRSLIADLIDKLFDNGVRAVGVDILFSEPDRSSPVKLAKTLSQITNEQLDLKGLPLETIDNDLRLKQAIANRPVVLGALGYLGSENTKINKVPHSIPFYEQKLDNPKGSYDNFEQLNENSIPSAQNYFKDINTIELPLEQLDASIGIFNVDADTSIRSIPLFYRAYNQIIAALSIATLQKLYNKPLRFITNKHGKFTVRFHKKLKFPLEITGTYRPYFRGPSFTFPYYSAASILNNEIDKNKLAEKIVFIGTSAAGLKDFRYTPFDPAMPGVEIHATVVDNILSGQGIIMPWYSSWINLPLIALSAIIASMLFCLAPIWLYSLTGISLIFGLLCLSYEFFKSGIFISPILPMLGVLLSALLCLPVRHFLYERQSRLLKNTFSRYVAPEVVDRIVAKGGEPMAGSQREVTILFTDVRNFTAISENLPPDKLVNLLNAYFTPMTACVTRHEGTLDKFIGDALMAFWNAPIDVKDHQCKAVATALAMQKQLAELRPRFKEQFGIDLYMGAGVNSGNAQVGNMGSNDLQDYTCIGDNVNLASRLESLCRTYGCDIVVSDSVQAACRNQYFFRPLDRVRVKGKNKFLNIFLPFAKNAPLDNAREKLWQEALQAYFAGNFDHAAQMFVQLKSDKTMTQAAELFIKRCANFAKSPPKHWDGIWNYASK